MGFAWKILIPVGLLNIAGVAAAILWVPSWRVGVAAFSWAATIAFVGLFDPVLKWRLRRERGRVPVVTS